MGRGSADEILYGSGAVSTTLRRQEHHTSEAQVPFLTIRSFRSFWSGKTINPKALRDSGMKGADLRQAITKEATRHFNTTGLLADELWSYITALKILYQPGTRIVVTAPITESRIPEDARNPKPGDVGVLESIDDHPGLFVDFEWGSYKLLPDRDRFAVLRQLDASA